MKLQSDSTLLMIGDSITDMGRARPVGTSKDGGLGDGYVSLINATLAAEYPQTPVRVLNTGIGGNTVRDLKSRWQTDVLDLKPDWLSIMIGTNDVWRQFDRPGDPASHVYAPEFEATLSELVVQTKPNLKGLVLMTPFYVQPDATEAMRVKMDYYGGIVKKIAVANEAYFVDTQAAFNLAMQHHNPLHLASDRVHPSLIGHMVLSLVFLKAVGFSL
jgi:lysophospholipase L1-like esterase